MTILREAYLPVVVLCVQCRVPAKYENQSENNATDVTGPCAAVQYELIMPMCGSQKMEFRHDGKTNRSER